MRDEDRSTNFRLLFVLVSLLSLISPALLAEGINDRAVTQAVKREMAVEPGISAHRIDVESQEGVVTLTGTVEHILARERAAEIARTVKGVRSVINRTVVSPRPRPDSEVQRDIKNALLSNAATEAFEVDVIVRDASVRLEGKVDSWQERELAGRVAKTVRGIKELENKLLVEADAERSDGEIQGEIEEILRWDARIDDALIGVAVQHREVSLTGTVGSSVEKARAEKLAWVRGVRSVDASQLRVESWAREERFRGDKYSTISDQEIQRALEDSFLYDPRVNSLELESEVDEGVVTLTGAVDTLLAKHAAETDAANVVGVIRVKNQLDVRPDQTHPDAEIEREVEAALRLDPYLEGQKVRVEVRSGDVHLYGTVDSEWEKRRAAQKAAEIAGVLYVANHLSLEGSANDEKEDWEIRQDIREELFWSPFVSAEEVNVEVDDGVATLTGTVDTWRERQAATENAREGGAEKVDNELEVTHTPLVFGP